MTSKELSSGRSCKIVTVAALIFVGAFSLAPCTGALVTYSVSAPATELWGTTTAFGGARLGDPFTFSFTYDPDLLPPQHSGDQTGYFSPLSSTLVTLSLGHVTYEMSENFSLFMTPHHTEFGGVNGDEIWSGDFAVFSVSSGPRSPTQPVSTAAFARLVFPEGSFDGDPTLPNFAPTNAFLSAGIDEGDIHSSALSITTGRATLSPVPEPATYGLVGALALVALAARKTRGIRRSA